MRNEVACACDSLRHGRIQVSKLLPIRVFEHLIPVQNVEVEARHGSTLTLPTAISHQPVRTGDCPEAPQSARTTSEPRSRAGADAPPEALGKAQYAIASHNMNERLSGRDIGLENQK